ncbi:hypothetical protein V8G54_010572 [Vigna mungo]|uniref:Protein kinase domain-containing protein n=1 Tax=Vigna mungo TaxID=3915 RepID=A0AAQ3NY89_VIGMU
MGGDNPPERLARIQDVFNLAGTQLLVGLKEKKKRICPDIFISETPRHSPPPLLHPLPSQPPIKRSLRGGCPRLRRRIRRKSHRPSRRTAISSFLLRGTGPNSEILPFLPPSPVVVATTWIDEAVGAFNATLPRKSPPTKLGSSLLLTSQEHHRGPPSSSSLAQTLLPSNQVESSNPSDVTNAKRFDIVVSVAMELEYLHHACEPSVIHGDIKLSNVLLDEDFGAKIGDFGLARVKAVEDLGMVEEKKERVVEIGVKEFGVMEEGESVSVVDVDRSPESCPLRVIS